VGFDCFTQCTRFEVVLCFHELADHRGAAVPDIASNCGGGRRVVVTVLIRFKREETRPLTLQTREMCLPYGGG
jgi:hypothetical protein